MVLGSSLSILALLRPMGILLYPFLERKDNYNVMNRSEILIAKNYRFFGL